MFVMSEEIVLAVVRRHRLAAKPGVLLSALADEVFILPPRETVPVYHDIVLKMCREAGFVPEAAHEADVLPIILSMVADGTGVALIPLSARKLNMRGVALVPLRPALPSLAVSLAGRREKPSPVLTEFVNVARRVLLRAGQRSVA
jgi:DNA-binding transcriptional LysR family regulator